MESFFRFVHTLNISEDHRRLFPVFLWMVISLSFIANAQKNERTSEYEISLTCIFGENLEDRRQAFRIIDARSDVALHCFWRKGKLFCTLEDGVMYDWSRSGKVAVRKIVQTQDHHSCSCFLTDHHHNDHERPCLTEVRPILEAEEMLELNDEPAEDTLSENSHSEASSANPQLLGTSSSCLIIVATLLGVILVRQSSPQMFCL